MSTTTTNYGWTVPSDTDYVKDGAAAIRTALGGVDTSMVGLRGGTTGQIIKKTSSTQMDFTWADGWNNFALVSQATLSTGTAYTISSINADTIAIKLDSASSSSASGALTITFNGDTSANYTYGWVGKTSSSASSGASMAATNVPFGTMGNAAADVIDGWLIIRGCKSSTQKKFFNGNFNCVGAGTVTNISAAISGSYESTTAITSVTLTLSAGTYDNGILYVYGA